MAVVLVLIAMALAACNPTGTDLEARTIRIMHQAVLGRQPRGQVACSSSAMDGETGHTQHWVSSCTLDGRAHRVIGLYTYSLPTRRYVLATITAQHGPWPDTKSYTCTFRRSEGGDDWHQEGACGLH